MKFICFLLAITYSWSLFGQVEVSFVDSVSFVATIEIEKPEAIGFFFYSGDSIYGGNNTLVNHEEQEILRGFSLVSNHVDSLISKNCHELSLYQPKRTGDVSVMPLYCVRYLEGVDQLATYRFARKEGEIYKEYLITFRWGSNGLENCLLPSNNDVYRFLNLLSEEGLTNFISPHSSNLYSKMGAFFFHSFPESGVNIDLVLKHYLRVPAAERLKWLEAANAKQVD